MEVNCVWTDDQVFESMLRFSLPCKLVVHCPCFCSNTYQLWMHDKQTCKERPRPIWQCERYYSFTNIVCPHKGPVSPATFQHKRTPPGGGISPDIGTYQDHTDLPCYPDDSASTTEFVTYGQGEVDFSSDQGYVAGDSPLFCIYDDCDIQSAASPPPGLDDYWVLATLFWTGGGWFYQDDSTCF